jgi:hypothetical protein
MPVTTAAIVAKWQSLDERLDVVRDVEDRRLILFDEETL